jgi:hypothetical protein
VGATISFCYYRHFLSFPTKGEVVDQAAGVAALAGDLVGAAAAIVFLEVTL